MDKLTTLSNTIKDHDETQQILADKIGVNRNQIRRWINGESEMGIYKLKAICEYYKVSADYILGLAPDMDWPRGKGEKGHTTNRTKYNFLYIQIKNPFGAKCYAFRPGRIFIVIREKESEQPTAWLPGFRPVRPKPWQPLYRKPIQTRFWEFTEKRYRDKIGNRHLCREEPAAGGTVLT